MKMSEAGAHMRTTTPSLKMCRRLLTPPRPGYQLGESRQGRRRGTYRLRGTLGPFFDSVCGLPEHLETVSALGSYIENRS